MSILTKQQRVINTTTSGDDLLHVLRDPPGERHVRLMQHQRLASKLLDRDILNGPPLRHCLREFFGFLEEGLIEPSGL